MTRKDYVLIAKAIKRTRDDNEFFTGIQVAIRNGVLTTLINYLVCSLQQDNPRFDVAQFRAACEEV